MGGTTSSKKTPNKWYNFMRDMGTAFLIGLGLFGLAWLSTVKDLQRETIWPLPRQHPALFLPNLLMLTAWIFLSFSLFALVGGAIVAIIKKEST